MSFENVVAMHVTDHAEYERYRAAMRPLLETYGGGFRFDFEVTETFLGPDHPVTRLFGIYIRDRAAREAFFADPAYLEIRRRHFDGAVDGFTVLAEYERPDEGSAGD